MKVTDVKTCVVSTPWRNLTFARVLTDEGIYGKLFDLDLDTTRPMRR